FDIVVNGRKVARRFANDHIGEMAAIQPTQGRSATVTATEKAVLCQLTVSAHVKVNKSEQWPLPGRQISIIAAGGFCF
ncbi:MAG: hypothetical protein RB191_13970, partial [Terriglobia bacterium]|nr:hypothetical protein [Terriglobia bacterium]